MSVLTEGGPPVRRICCIGAGFVGGPTAAVIASRNPSVSVTVVDINEQLISMWNSEALPISEPGLLDLLHEARDGHRDIRSCTLDLVDSSKDVSEPNLHFSTDISGAIRRADLVMIAVNTPASGDETDFGAAPDLARLMSAVEMVGNTIEQDTIIVTKSTVPCGTADKIQEVLEDMVSPTIRVEVISNPEFLAQGTAIDNLLTPDRVLIGSSSTHRGRLASERLSTIYETWVKPECIVRMGTRSSEISKLAANALLAQRVSSINALSNICEALDADISEVSRACGLDHRIGSHMLRASVGFGGSCFGKDLLHLVHLARSQDLNEVAAYWRTVLDINEHQRNRFVDRIVSKLPNSSLTVIGVLGFAFKAGTNDSRGSAAISIVKQLLKHGYRVQIYDPEVPAAMIRSDIEDDSLRSCFQNAVKICSTAYEACLGAHGVAILTEHEEFVYTKSKNIIEHGIPTPPNSSNGIFEDDDKQPDLVTTHTMDWEHIHSIMNDPWYIFDGRNIIDKNIEDIGFHIEAIGRAGRHGAVAIPEQKVT